MSTVVKRGYCQDDPKEFGPDSIEKLQKAGRDVRYLLNQGYPVKSATTFVGNHYLMSERQRLALARAISANEAIALRKSKEVVDIPAGWMSLSANTLMWISNFEIEA